MKASRTKKNFKYEGFVMKNQKKLRGNWNVMILKILIMTFLLNQNYLACMKRQLESDSSIQEQSRVLSGHTGSVMSLALLRWENEDYLISASCDATIKIWHFSSGQCVKTLCGHSGDICELLIVEKSTGEYVIVSSSPMDNTIKVWDFPSGQCTQTIEVHNSSNNRCKIAHAGPRCFAFNTDDEVKVFNVLTHDYEEMLPAQCTLIHGKSEIFWLDNSHYASQGFDERGKQGIDIWNSLEGKRTGRLDHPFAKVIIKPYPDIVITGAECEGQGELKIWNWKTGQCLYTSQPEGTVYSEAFGALISSIQIPYERFGALQRIEYCPDVYYDQGVSAFALAEPGKILIGGSCVMALFDYEKRTLLCKEKLDHGQKHIHVRAIICHKNLIIYAGWNGWGIDRDRTANNIHIISPFW